MRGQTGDASEKSRLPRTGRTCRQDRPRQLVRVVAGMAAPWLHPEPPPLLALGQVDLQVLPDLCLFSGRKLRAFA